jgi:hypothetical protein
MSSPRGKRQAERAFFAAMGSKVPEVSVVDPAGVNLARQLQERGHPLNPRKVRPNRDSLGDHDGPLHLDDPRHDVHRRSP